jgi:hypothetical protein
MASPPMTLYEPRDPVSVMKLNLIHRGVAMFASANNIDTDERRYYYYRATATGRPKFTSTVISEGQPPTRGDFTRPRQSC